MSGISDLVKDYEEYVEISEQIDSLVELKKTLTKERDSDDLAIELNITGLDAQIEYLKSTRPESSSDELVYKKFEVDSILVKEFFELLSRKCINALFDSENKAFKTSSIKQTQLSG
jgi:hypothetical protein